MSFGKVEAGSGLNWLTEGIRLVIANPVAFLVMGLILAVDQFRPDPGRARADRLRPGAASAASSTRRASRPRAARPRSRTSSARSRSPERSARCCCLPAGDRRRRGAAGLRLRVRPRCADRRRAVREQRPSGGLAGAIGGGSSDSLPGRDRADVPDLRAAVLRGAARHARRRRTVYGDAESLSACMANIGAFLRLRGRPLRRVHRARDRADAGADPRLDRAGRGCVGRVRDGRVLRLAAGLRERGEPNTAAGSPPPCRARRAANRSRASGRRASTREARMPSS